MRILPNGLYRSDVFGAIANGLCLVHCMITPIIFAVKPVLDNAFLGQAQWGHYWASLDYAFWIISFVAVWISARNTSNRKIKWAFWVAWFVFAVGIILGANSVEIGSWLMHIGSLSLLLAHIKNYQYCQICAKESNI